MSHCPIFISGFSFLSLYYNVPKPCFFPSLNSPLQVYSGVFKTPLPLQSPFLKSPSQETSATKFLQVPFPSGTPFFNDPQQQCSLVLILPSVKYPWTHSPSVIISLVSSLHLPSACPALNSPLSTPFSVISTPMPSGLSLSDFPQYTFPFASRQVPTMGLPCSNSPLQQFPEGMRYHWAPSFNRGDYVSSFFKNVRTRSLSFLRTIIAGTTRWLATYFDQITGASYPLMIRVDGLWEIPSESLGLFYLPASEDLRELRLSGLSIMEI